MGAEGRPATRASWVPAAGARLPRCRPWCRPLTLLMLPMSSYMEGRLGSCRHWPSTMNLYCGRGGARRARGGIRRAPPGRGRARSGQRTRRPHLVHAGRQQLDEREVLAAAPHRVALRPVVKRPLQLHLAAAVPPHNHRGHQLGLRAPPAGAAGRGGDATTAPSAGPLEHHPHAAAAAAAEVAAHAPLVSRKLALPVHAAAAAVLVALGDGLHRHLRAVRQRRAGHRGRAARAVVRVSRGVGIVVAVAAAVPPWPRLALRLALRGAGRGGAGRGALRARGRVGRAHKRGLGRAISVDSLGGAATAHHASAGPRHRSRCDVFAPCCPRCARAGRVFPSGGCRVRDLVRLHGYRRDRRCDG